MNPVSNINSSYIQDMMQEYKKIQESVDTMNFIHYNYGVEIGELYKFSLDTGYQDPYEFICSNNLVGKSLDEIKVLWSLYTDD